MRTEKEAREWIYRSSTTVLVLVDLTAEPGCSMESWICVPRNPSAVVWGIPDSWRDVCTSSFRHTEWLISTWLPSRTWRLAGQAPEIKHMGAHYVCALPFEPIWSWLKRITQAPPPVLPLIWGKRPPSIRELVFCTQNWYGSVICLFGCAQAK